MPLLADRDLTARGIEVDLCGHRRAMAAGPAALALATGVRAAPGVDPLRAPRRLRLEAADRHHVPRPRPGAPGRARPRERATAMTQQCADVLGEAIAGAHRRLAHAAAGLRRRPRPGGAAVRIGIVCPYSFDVPGRSAVPRPRPRRALPGSGSPRVGPGPGRRRHPAARLRRVGRARRPGPLQRLGGPAELRAGDRRPGRPLARARRLRRGPHPRAGDAQHLACSPCGPPRGPSSPPSTPPTSVPGDAGGLPAAAAEPGEDRRPDRGLRGRPPHRHDARRRRRRRDPQRRQRRTVRQRTAASRVAGERGSARPSPSWAGSTSPARACRCWRAAMPEVLAAYPGARLLVVGPGDAASARERLDPEVGRRQRVPRRRSATPTRPSLLASVDLYVAPAHRRRELRHRPRRGDERRRPGHRQRPAGLPARARRRSGRRHLPQRGHRGSRCRGRQAARATPQPGPRSSRRGCDEPGHFDWSVVAEEVMAVYEMVTHGAGRVRADMSGDTRWTQAPARAVTDG